jgi:hypothetical protein
MTNSLYVVLIIKPKLLGRAKDISDFVKHGQERALIEIELKNEDPIIITRTIEKSTNSSKWKINGNVCFYLIRSSVMNLSN